ncbi:hypothetical protein C1645_830949 [Glomus cerebriforme]|uniref:DNA-directed DNA polymerase n=1 Tax=Glomus cerebriforme TaxID=658196 RepID=A0A397SRP2_9GLOM|nr:hypothetical protein C1645_830949 [Glomus cerebriforme]
MTLHWKDDPKSLKQICLVDVDIELNPGWTIINISSQHTQMDVRANKRGTIKASEEGEEDSEEKEYLGGPIRIKITSDESDDFISSFFKLPGYVPIDVQVYLKKHFPHSKVKKEGLLNSSYKSAVLTVRLTCYMIKCEKSIQREVASIVYISLFNTHYCANGMKVCNFLDAYAVKQDIVISTRVSENIEKGKYPDAYVFPPKKGIKTRRPVTELDFASLYPSIIMTYNLSPEKFIFDPKDVDIVQNNGNNLHKIKFSFNKIIIQAWLELKACLTPLEKKKRCLEKMISLAKERGKRILESLFSEYSSEVKNSKSSIFLHKLACETTTAGKYNLNLVAEFVTKKGFGIKYGDTDSLYLTCPDRYYEKCDEAFARKELSKEVYWAEMVNITIAEKTFHERDRYCKARKIPASQIHWKENTLKKAQNKKWDFNEFIVMGTWKPKKKNLYNNCFMKYMRERNERIPDPGERFSYIIVKGPLLYNKKSRKEPHRVGDYMEYTNIAKEENMKIDINYYLGTTVAMCACFINEDDRYQPLPSHKITQLKNSDEKEKQINIYFQKEAKKCLEKYIKSLQ